MRPRTAPARLVAVAVGPSLPDRALAEVTVAGRTLPSGETGAVRRRSPSTVVVGPLVAAVSFPGPPGAAPDTRRRLAWVEQPAAD